MAKVSVYNMNGEVVSDIELNDDIFGVEVNEHVLHLSVIQYLANQRQGTKSAKTRAEVRGGGRKPWRQKGTGRARQGSIRSPQWRGGGVVFAPKPRSYSFKLNKKVKKLAMKCAFAAKLADDQFIVVDELKFDEIKTKQVVNVCKNLKAEKALFVVAEGDKNLQLSARNIEGVKTASVSTLNTYDILKYDKLVLTKEAIAKIEEVYA